ncbi:CASP-like protein ARALYDRAFT_485429 [Gossypium raimondii]|uniref:CASP-like protein n=1 Tax=Gossypium raimondii TaxID=29730 RepID=A0A0D2QWA1_GOSRA|nr:CASP-like protein ARALYDRAFT_485429 [Gossypium raimondii]KJB62257.1 hypothetical protein B456_009G408600 [Gossypium raimondii]
MQAVLRALGTSARFTLRLGQTVFSTALLLFMCLDVEFYSYTSFSYLVTVMGLVTPWSMSLALVDAYFVFVKGLPRQPRVLLVVIVGDWALSFLSLAATCSTASVTSLLVNVSSTYYPSNICSRYQLSAAMAFMSWFLSFDSILFNLWLLPSL